MQRAYLHVAGPAGSGKTALIDALLRHLDADMLAARCVRNDTLREPRESAPRGDPELTRYRAAGASRAARYAFPPDETMHDAFFATDLMAEYSEAVVIEGDSPLAFTHLSVFVAPAPRAGGRLYVRRKHDRAKEERAKARAWERLLREPDGVAQLFGQLAGAPFADLVRRNPKLAEETRTKLLAGIRQVRKAAPPEPTEHWAIAPRFAGIETAQLVIVNIHGDRDRARAGRLVTDVLRLRREEELFADILGARGSRVPITAVVANLADPRDAGYRRAIARVRRSMKASGDRGR
jgi:molybdopterin-guanine dinucleotide biosynthesis protein